MRIRSLLILASAVAILSSAIPVLSPYVNISTGNNQNLSNAPMANNKLPKMETRPQERPKKIYTAEEKAAQIQEWEEKLHTKNTGNWERYQRGIERARKRANDAGKDPDDAALNYSWSKLQISLRMLQKRLKKKTGNYIKRKGPGRPRIEIDPAEIAAWEAKIKRQRGWKRHLNGMKRAEARAIEDGKNAEEVKEAVAQYREAAFIQWRSRELRQAGLETKTDINHSESVA
ncbi:hypothetical protein H0H93_015719, partial [Arthromyces matolae]